MAAPTSLLVQTLTAATNSFPEAHIDYCVNCLGFTLECAGFENVSVSDNPAFGRALECDRDGQHHVALMLILPADLYETTSDAIEEFADTLMDCDEHLEDLVGALGDSALDVASICFDPVNSRCRIHHPQNILRSDILMHEPQHFFIPAGTDETVPAERYLAEERDAPLALNRLVAATR